MLKNKRIRLVEASNENVDLLIKWTLDSNAQGAYKSVPDMNEEALKTLFLHNNERQYYMIQTFDGKPIGRFYYRKWLFTPDLHTIDWELNIIIADPEERGKGYGTDAQKLAITHLQSLPHTNSIFAYTMNENIGERKALEKCGFECVGDLKHDYYAVDLGVLKPEHFVLFVLKE